MGDNHIFVTGTTDDKIRRAVFSFPIPFEREGPVKIPSRFVRDGVGLPCPGGNGKRFSRNHPVDFWRIVSRPVNFLEERSRPVPSHGPVISPEILDWSKKSKHLPKSHPTVGGGAFFNESCLAKAAQQQRESKPCQLLVLEYP